MLEGSWLGEIYHEIFNDERGLFLSLASFSLCFIRKAFTRASSKSVFAMAINC